MPRAAAHDVILEILRSTEDGEWTGKTRLFKAFYFAHLYYATKNPGLLTDWRIAHMPEGPGIDQSAKLFGTLVDNDLLTVEKIHEGLYPEYRYRLTKKGRAGPAIPEQAADAVKEAVRFCQNKTAAELSRYTHEYSRSWKQGRFGDILDIYIDIVGDDEYELRQEDAERLNEFLPKIFGEG